MLLKGRTVILPQRRTLGTCVLAPKRHRQALPKGRTTSGAVVLATAAPTLADVPGIPTTHDANVHGTSGAVTVEKPGLKRATDPRSIIFVTSEVAPWSKTGGLADVLGSLPFALAQRGHRVMVVAPRYVPYEGVEDTGVRVQLLGHAEVGYFHAQIRGVDFVFVDHPSYPRPGGLYADAHGVYGDNQFRFQLLCLAALEAPFFLDLPVPPQQLPAGQQTPLDPTPVAPAAAPGAAGAEQQQGDGDVPHVYPTSSSSGGEAAAGAAATNGASSSSSNGAKSHNSGEPLHAQHTNGTSSLPASSSNSPSSSAPSTSSSSSSPAAPSPPPPRTKYGQDVMFIANDWHAALVPVYLAAKYRPHGVYGSARCVLAIHNLRHQGVFSPASFATLGLPDQWYGCLEWQYPPHQRQGSWAEEGRSVNHLKAGLTTADRIVTVSAGYAEEIKTWLGGWGMEGILAARAPVLNGVVNGIDTDEWNPATDPHLPYNYDTTNFVEGKARCKMELQRELGLPVSEHTPLVAFIGRLDPQKGADILLAAAEQLLRQQDVQLVCLGSGTPDLEAGLRWLEGEFRDRARGWVGFNVPFSHRLTAAADILLMPSRFEPCGLNQLYAMRYGTVPVAHKTGGLRDTVLDFDPWSQSGTGWTYTSCDPQGLLHATGLALLTYRNHREDFRKLQLRGMQREASWDQAAQQYEQIISWALVDPPYCQ
ncbi:hypothetical protein Agub_g2250 [Astrephomene gubernaculifera]|uniref:Starch synthase, chloroplastic/amyloplastic n=1 Tax=Astrephomene gubernaculifera TaxID=47775 RepID=A0AAD3DIU6_9CHLO|nr:hypothetical protein Agub_g2250 [Astrephomene gubernaculifera]